MLLHILVFGSNFHLTTVNYYFCCKGMVIISIPTWITRGSLTDVINCDLYSFIHQWVRKIGKDNILKHQFSTLQRVTEMICYPKSPGFQGTHISW
jgi:hypothetical protein